MKGWLSAIVVLAIVALTPGCDRAATPPGTSETRIVTVGGAVTEIVFALGAGDHVVAVDTSSLHPEAAIRLPKVGYQRQLAAEGLLGMRPTMVIASAEAGPPAAIDQLRGAGVHVALVDSETTIEGARARIGKIASILGRDPAPVYASFDRDLARALAEAARAREKPRVLAIYSRGGGAMHVFGRDTAVDTLIHLAGAANAASAVEGTKALTAEAVVQTSADAILVPARGLDSLGGVSGLLKVPGVAETPAGRARRVIAMDDLLMLGLGPRAGEAALELARKVHAPDGGGR
ncbi:MAG: ABC transporter substrate-binding protein [Labilithrix sp.]|nr:ABC transporter substrate-binding protein [Labilithrix sp.]